MDETQQLSWEDYRRVTEPLPVTSARRWMHGGLSIWLRTVGQLSDGIRLGYETGFDSGRSLDYGYANQAGGHYGVGRWIDRAYLNAKGWRAIRQRRDHIQHLLARVVRTAIKREGSAHVLDVGAGCGRCVLDTLGQSRLEPVSATLLDLHGDNFEQAKRLAAAAGLHDVRFEVGDAFDEKMLATIRPTPQVAVVSGLYELFVDNQPVARSLRGLAAGLSDHGTLIYTGHPYHPQRELIARVLPSHRGPANVMRLRSQTEMDEIVRDAGFEILETLTDPWGIFMVTLAQRAAG